MSFCSKRGCLNIVATLLNRLWLAISRSVSKLRKYLWRSLHFEAGLQLFCHLVLQCSATSHVRQWHLYMKEKAWQQLQATGFSHLWVEYISASKPVAALPRFLPLLLGTHGKSNGRAHTKEPNQSWTQSTVPVFQLYPREPFGFYTPKDFAFHFTYYR